MKTRAIRTAALSIAGLLLADTASAQVARYTARAMDTVQSIPVRERVVELSPKTDSAWSPQVLISPMQLPRDQEPLADGPGERRGATRVEIVIARWSSDEEGRLFKTFTAKGQREMVGEMQKIDPPIGRIGITGETTYHLRYASATELEDGMTQVLIATEREMSFEEVVEKPASFDYPFTLIELHVDENGEGEGRVSIATRVVWDKKANVLELEDYNSAPIWLKNVQRTE